MEWHYEHTGGCFCYWNFRLGETITGGTSGASRVLRLRDIEPDNVEYADNFTIETEADAIIDFSEQNPFGTPK